MATETQAEPILNHDFRHLWLLQNADALGTKESYLRTQINALGKDTPYKRSIQELAAAHREAAAVYRRRIEEL